MNPLDRSRTPERRPATYTVPASAEYERAKAAVAAVRALNVGDINSAIPKLQLIARLEEKHPQLAQKLLPTE